VNNLTEIPIYQEFWLLYFLAGIVLALIFEIIISILKILKKTKTKAYAIFPSEIPIQTRLLIMFFYPYMLKTMHRDIRNIIKN